MKEPVVHVGIMSAAEVALQLQTPYCCNGTQLCGPLKAEVCDGQIVCGPLVAQQLHFEPTDEQGRFCIENVVIGVQFHWQRLQSQTFQGALTLRLIEGKIQIINEVRAEDYLRSVIGSEMNSTASAELLKAHAVISRSWLLCRILRDNPLEPFPIEHDDASDTADRIVRWYGRDEHTDYDVCADDHCQRYQGIGHVVPQAVDAAIEATRGMVLTYEGSVCDARFYKCCGGATETYPTAWEQRHVPYLQAVRDDKDQQPLPDLTKETEAQAWIAAAPDCFCHTDDPALLRQVLNDYDLETSDFFRWQVHLSQEQLQQLLLHKSGIDFGDIFALNPLERGKSGRISLLEIVGSKRTVRVGKELEIRKWLSDSHLYSSAFWVETGNDGTDVPPYFVLHGAGWGHGVGLCQIGAAAMGAQGYEYDQILSHYYPHTTITKIYE